MKEVCPVKTREIKLGGSSGLSTTVDESDYIFLNLGSHKWYQYAGNSATYARTKINGKAIILHRLIMGIVDSPSSVCVDHIDHNGLNNSRANLRITDKSGNARNSHKRVFVKISSCYKGVGLVRNRTNPWRARIGLLDEERHLGYYPTEVEAAQAYNKAATELFGEFACLNVIP